MTPPCDRRNNTRGGLQAGFIERFGVPLFWAAARLLPPLEPLARQAEANQSAWCKCGDAEAVEEVRPSRGPGLCSKGY